ncbi:MAG: PDZ domain-containing protein [Patescibacteria group bacterium]|nr:PDZ domain-containing protein [Patescibacteria group bacterium]
MEKKATKIKKVFRAAAFCGLVFVLSGLSLVVIDRYLFPKMVSIEWLAKYKIFKKATENVVVVNKTEQMTVSEEQTISRYSNKSASSVVEIVSRRKKETKAVGLNVIRESKIGSGLLVTADGLVITHKDAFSAENSDYEILAGTGEKYKAKLIFVDSFSDMALFKMENAENLSTASFISPEDINIGAKVAVIGRSGDNAQISFKSGLIGRFAQSFSTGGAIASSDKLQGVYFVDIEINEEEDASLVGCAVADYNGNIVGILGSRKTGSYRQYFIIPVNYVESLVDQFIEKGSVPRGSLGAYYFPLTKENSIQTKDGREIEKGALVYSPSFQQGLAVISGSAAEKAGILVGDVILSVNGEEVNSNQNLAQLISKYKPGDVVDLKVIRDEKEMNAKVILQ